MPRPSPAQNSGHMSLGSPRKFLFALVPRRGGACSSMPGIEHDRSQHQMLPAHPSAAAGMRPLRPSMTRVEEHRCRILFACSSQGPPPAAAPASAASTIHPDASVCASSGGWEGFSRPSCRRGRGTKQERSLLDDCCPQSKSCLIHPRLPGPAGSAVINGVKPPFQKCRFATVLNVKHAVRFTLRLPSAWRTHIAAHLSCWNAR